MTDAALRTANRSQTGCWTCRLRRKKCDEEPGACKICASLQICCSGYGPRPSWMNGGMAEKQKAQEIKEEIRMHRKRRHRRQRSNRSPFDRYDSPLAADVIEVESTSGNNLDPTPMLDESQMQESLESFLHQDTNNRSPVATPTYNNHSSWLYGIEPQLDTFRKSMTPLNGGPFPPVTDLISVDFDWANCTDFPLASMDNLTAVEQRNLFQNTPALVETAGSPGSHEFIEEDSPSSSDDETHLVYQYVKFSVPSLFPFIDESARVTLRDMLLSLEAKVHVSWSSTLAHSAALRATGLKRYGLSSDIAPVDKTTRWRSKALQHIKNITNYEFKGEQHRLDTQSAADLGICLAQLFLLQILNGSLERDILMESTKPYVRYCKTLPIEDHPLLRFLYNIFVTIGVFWSASKRRRMQLFTYTPSFYLGELDDTQPDPITGCQLWVIRYISEIIQLRYWKTESLVSRSLNVAELVKRATKLEQQILNRHHSSTFDSRSDQYQESAGITEVYVNAALVYIHVVLSGPHPEVSEIRRTVESTIAAIKGLTHANLVCRLAWPICLAASLAESRHEEFFNKLEQGMRGDQDGSVSVLRALTIARECQRLRQENLNNSATFDWIDALESLSERWILL